ncbi:pilus assembly protein PilX, partial [Acinetobacter baumannii]|nr:pilus assembly protein PilX [Acinetobacter baumannii]
MKLKQGGSALIVVLIFLVAIMIIGTIAIRKGLINLNIATNSQVQQ